MVTQTNGDEYNNDQEKVEAQKHRNFNDAIAKPKFYPDLPMIEKDAVKDEILYRKLLLWDATIRDWEADYGSSQYCLVKASYQEPGKEREFFVFKIGGKAVVRKMRDAINKRLFPSSTGLAAMFTQVEGLNQPYYDIV